MVLNPFYIMLLVYAFANTFAYYKILDLGGFYVFDTFWIVSAEVATLTYFLHIFLFSLFFLFFSCSLSLARQSRIISNSWGWFLVVVTVSFFVFNSLTGAGKAGSGFSFGGSSYLNFIFVFLQPDLLFLLMAPFLRSNRLFFLGISVYFISLLSRGWMGSVLIVFIIMLIRFYPYRLSLSRAFLLFFLFIFTVLLLPVFDALKWGMRLGQSPVEVFSHLLSNDYFSVLRIVLVSVVERFQNINYAAFLIQNKDLFFRDLLSGNYQWFYQDGIFNSVFCKLVSCPPDINSYLARYMVNDDKITWNIDPGLTGWFGMLGFLAPFLFVFVVFIVGFGFWLFNRVFGVKGVLLFGVFTLVYFFHGWLNAYYNFLIYGVAYSFVLLARIRK